MDLGLINICKQAKMAWNTHLMRTKAMPTRVEVSIAFAMYL